MAKATTRMTIEVEVEHTHDAKQAVTDVVADLRTRQVGKNISISKVTVMDAETAGQAPAGTAADYRPVDDIDGI